MAAQEFDVFVLGSIVRDVVIEVPGMVAGEEGFSLGYGLKTLINSHEPNVPGGSAANFGLAYQKLSSKEKSVALIGIMGEDGNELLKKIKDAGIDTSFIKISSEYETDTSYILISRDGTTTDRSILVLKNAIRHLSKKQIPDVLNTKSVVFTSIPYAAKSAVERLLENNAPIKLAAISQTMIDEYQGMNKLEELKELMRKANFCIMNETEAQLLYKSDDQFEKLTEYFPLVEKMRRDLGLDQAIITCGKLGSVGCNKEGEAFAVEAPKLNRIYNTTGAGDTYSAGVVFSLQNEVKIPVDPSKIDELQKAMLVGTAAASMKLSNENGERPNKAQIENYLSHASVKQHKYLTFNLY